MANIDQNNIPKSLNMNNFMAALNSGGQLAKNCRFIAQIKSTAEESTLGTSLISLIPNDLHLMCEAVEFPGRGFNVTETRYYGPSMVFPNNTMYGGSASMSFICRNNSPERLFFDEWMELINPTTSFNFEYPMNYWAEIDIFQLSEVGVGRSGKTDTKLDPTAKLEQQASYAWTLRNVWPTLIAPQQVTWADQDILRLQVTFAYKYWDRPRVSR